MKNVGIGQIEQDFPKDYDYEWQIHIGENWYKVCKIGKLLCMAEDMKERVGDFNVYDNHYFYKAGTQYQHLNWKLPDLSVIDYLNTNDITAVYDTSKCLVDGASNDLGLGLYYSKYMVPNSSKALNANYVFFIGNGNVFEKHNTLTGRFLVSTLPGDVNYYFPMRLFCWMDNGSDDPQKYGCRKIMKNKCGKPFVLDSEGKVIVNGSKSKIVCPHDVVKDRMANIGGQFYKTVRIDRQEWMAEDLRLPIKDSVIEDIDWTNKYDRLGYFWSVKFENNVITSLELANSQSSGKKRISGLSFRVTEGDVIEGRITNSATHSFWVVDKNNNIVIPGKGSFGNSTFIMPEGAYMCYVNYDLTKVHKLIQKKHVYNDSGVFEYNHRYYSGTLLIQDNEVMTSVMKALMNDGWRLPTAEEFKALINKFGYAGLKSEEGWTTPGTNTSGLGFKPDGYYDENGNWTQTDNNVKYFTGTYPMILTCDDTEAKVISGNIATSMPIRLVRDLT